MSLVGLRSYEYQRATVLADKLKTLIERVEADPVGAAHDAPQRRGQLALQLDAVAQLLDPLAPGATIHAEDALRLPVPMLRDLREREVDGRPLRDALLETVERLRHGGELDEDDREVMRVVLEAATGEAADAFNRVVHR